MMRTQNTQKKRKLLRKENTKIATNSSFSIRNNETNFLLPYLSIHALKVKLPIYRGITLQDVTRSVKSPSFII